VAIALFIVPRLNKWKIALELSSNSKLVQGEIVNRSSEGTAIIVTYRYTALDPFGTPRKFFGQTNNDRYRVGETVNIIYSSLQPGISGIESETIRIRDFSSLFGGFGVWTL
jgi:hypothetical protein